MCVCIFSAGLAQIAKKRPTAKGPRALGLIELAENGKAHLVPVTIMLDGRFYDAAAYKADPVPMALQYETVYEALKSGVSQGLFTVSGAYRNPEGWFGDGTWKSAADIEAEKAKSKAEAEKRAQKAPDTEIGGPPKLRRAPGSDDKSESSSKSSAPASTTPAEKPADKPKEPSPTLDKPASSSSSSSSPPSLDDPNRPMLRRQPVSDTAKEQTKASPESAPLKGPLTFIPAISDAEGPEPRPYTYQMTPAEEQDLTKKMSAMASDEVRERASHIADTTSSSKPTKGAKAKTAATAQFSEQQLHVFDLSSSNEPIIVFTGRAKMPAAKTDVEFMVTLVARKDIYGDLHKAFAQTTDSQHLDALPRYDLIDAVDVDGDGRGELLFRQSWESGWAFVVYRVIGDQLWPLFEGKPGS